MMVGFWFTKDQFDLAKAYNDRRIDVAPGYIIKGTECSQCGKNYKECEHSKYMDDNVSEIVIDGKMVSIVWTDRKA